MTACVDNFTVPTIRLDDADKEKTISLLRDTCINVGFFYLEGHGIEESLLDAVMEQSQELFDLSLASKRAMSDPVMSRGYTAMQEETLDPSKQSKGDTKEGFYIGREIPTNDPRYNPEKLAGPNQWPSSEKCPDMRDCDLFRETMETYFDQISNVGFQVVRLLARAIGVVENHFDNAFSEPIASIRLLHYAAEKSNPDDGVYACGAHSDYGMITLLLTDENRGLQILTKSNKWIDVPPKKGAFVVNLGDMLERWTNGLFRSTKHRVLTSGEKERYSIPFFYEPNFDTTVRCLDVCCSEGKPAKYPPTTSGQHLLDKYAETHSDFKPKDKK